MAPSSPTLAPLLALFLILPSAAAAAIDDSVVFPNPYPEAFRTLSVLVSLIGVTVLSFCYARRINGFTLEAPPSRWILLAVFIDSWIFIFSSALMVSGIGLSFNEATCRGAIFLCIVFYASSKVLVYTFLAERVHAVHPGVGRLTSTAYRICLAFLTGYVVIIILLLWGRISFLRDGTSHHFPYTAITMDGSDNACVIGLVTPTSLSLLVYDLILNVLFTCLFLHPLYRSSYRLTPRLRRLASRTLVAAAVALVTSAVNIVILTVMHGQQLGWVCLGSCGTDVTVNAVALYFVTGAVDEASSQIPPDHAASPPSKRQSGTTLRKTKTARSPEEAPDACSLSNKGILANDIPSSTLPPQRTVHFPGAARTTGSDISEYEMSDKIDATDPEQTTAGFFMSTAGSGANGGVEESKHQARESYLGVPGVTGGRKAALNSEKRYLDITTTVHDSEMPRCTTPEGEPTEVHIRTEGLAPRPKARLQPRGDARTRPASASSKRSHNDLEAQVEVPASATFVSKVVAKFRSSDKDAPPPSTSMIVNVKTLTEEHTDSSQQFDVGQPRWKTLRSQGGQAYVETGL